MRIYELAKELDIPTKELVYYFQNHNVEAKNHMSSVNEKAAELARRHFKTSPAEEKPEKPKADPPDASGADSVTSEKPAAKPTTKPAAKPAAKPAEPAPAEKKPLRGR